MSAKPSAKQLRIYVRSGVAMPNGSYWIVDAEDLQNAIHAVGRGNADHDDIRKHIIKRAHALKLDKEIPDNWNPDGSLKQPAAAAQSAVEAGQEFIQHFGRKGMKWGTHVFGGGANTGGVNEHSSADAARAAKTAEIIRKHGVHAVSTPDLQHLVSRQGLEQQHARLMAGGKNQSEAQKLVKNIAKQQAQSLANQYAAKGAEHLAKHVAKKIAG